MSGFWIGDIVEIDGIPALLWEVVKPVLPNSRGGEESCRVKFWGVPSAVRMEHHVQQRLMLVNPDQDYLTYTKDMTKANEMLVIALAGEDSTYKFPDRA